MISWRSPVALSLIVPALLAAQAPRRAAPAPATVSAPAWRALIEGRYDEVDGLADRMDPRDPSVVVMKARAAIARGRYEAAEALLRPASNRMPAGDASLELGLLRQMLGRPDAGVVLARVAESAVSGADAREMARGARALRALGRFQDANAAYRRTASLAPDDPDINTGWGELFLEKYNKAEALKSFQIAIKADPRFVPAIVGAARALADDNPPQAVAFAKHALEVNPSSVDALVFLAEQAADAGHKDEARETLKKALAVNPSSLDVHGLLAGLAYVEDKHAEFDAEVAAALAIAPRFGGVYRIAGELAAHNYRFDEAVELTRRALAIDGSDGRSLAALGTHLMRTGDEAGARAALDASFKADPFDVSVFNQLRLLDTLDTFETIRDGDLVVRISKDEAPVLKEYAIPLAHEALKTMSARYEFTPKGPFLIEIFFKHDDFAVRTVGLPGFIGALGACFGRVVTMDSPKARPPGEFQWEATLWHELAHVVTVQMSNQRVPRWLTEGISVYEEKRARAEWARQQDVEFAGMLERGDAIPLADLNAAFTDPRKISIAYYEASLLVDYLVRTAGQNGLNRLLRAYGQGLDTDAALKAVLNTSLSELQGGFDRMLDGEFGTMRRALALPKGLDLARQPIDALKTLAGEHPASFYVQMALGRALEKSGDTAGAVTAYERAAAALALPAGPESPHASMAAIAVKRKDTRRAIAELTALIGVDFDNVEAARQLAALLKETHVTDSAVLGPVYARISAVDPYDADAHAMLGRLAMQAGRFDEASREFRAVIGLKPVDRAVAYTDLAESYFKGGRVAEAKAQTLAALEIAPGYERAQDLLLALVGPK